MGCVWTRTGITGGARGGGGLESGAVLCCVVLCGGWVVNWFPAIALPMVQYNIFSVVVGTIVVVLIKSVESFERVWLFLLCVIARACYTSTCMD